VEASILSRILSLPVEVGSRLDPMKWGPSWSPLFLFTRWCAESAVFSFLSPASEVLLSVFFLPERIG